MASKTQKEASARYDKENTKQLKLKGLGVQELLDMTCENGRRFYSI